ncbi:Unknown protein, partial [Striga hermonthica]
LFSNTALLFDVDNIYLSPPCVLKQNAPCLRKSRKMRVNRGKYKECKQRLRKKLFSNTVPLFDVDNIYLSSHRVLKQNGTHLRKSRKIRVNRGKYEKCKQRLRKDLFSNTAPLFDVDNIYLSHHHVLKQNGTHLRKSRKIRVNRGKYEKCKQRLRKDLFSNKTPLFDVDNIYLSPHRVLKQNGTRLRKSRKIKINKGKNEKCYQRLRKDLRRLENFVQQLRSCRNHCSASTSSQEGLGEDDSNKFVQQLRSCRNHCSTLTNSQEGLGEGDSKNFVQQLRSCRNHCSTSTNSQEGLGEGDSKNFVQHLRSCRNHCSTSTSSKEGLEEDDSKNFVQQLRSCRNHCSTSTSSQEGLGEGDSKNFVQQLRSCRNHCPTSTSLQEGLGEDDSKNFAQQLRSCRNHCSTSTSSQEGLREDDSKNFVQQLRNCRNHCSTSTSSQEGLGEGDSKNFLHGLPIDLPREVGLSHGLLPRIASVIKILDRRGNKLVEKVGGSTERLDHSLAVMVEKNCPWCGLQEGPSTFLNSIFPLNQDLVIGLDQVDSQPPSLSNGCLLIRVELGDDSIGSLELFFLGHELLALGRVLFSQNLDVSFGGSRLLEHICQRPDSQILINLRNRGRYSFMMDFFLRLSLTSEGVKSCRYHRLTYAATKKSQSTTTDRAMMTNRCFPFKDAMPESQYIGRLQRESSPPAFRLEIRQQPGEDDQFASEF